MKCGPGENYYFVLIVLKLRAMWKVFEYQGRDYCYLLIDQQLDILMRRDPFVTILMEVGINGRKR